MGLKKRSKISAEFNMSSLTDIIFLLLIFFMLTSSLVAPNGVNMRLPGAGNPGTESSEPPEVRVRQDGSFTLNGRKMSSSILEKELRSLKRGGEDSFLLSPDGKAPLQSTIRVWDIAQKYNLKPIWALEE